MKRYFGYKKSKTRAPLAHDMLRARMKTVSPLPLPDQSAFVSSILDQGAAGCHDEKTEVLTERGWITWPEYSSELLATVNQATGALEYQEPSAVTRAEYKGKLYKTSNERLDFAVTPNHRMWVRAWNQPRMTMNDHYEFRTADRLGWYSGLLAAPTGWTGVHLDRISVGNRQYDGDDFVALVSLIISDGWAGSTPNTHNRVGFCCFRDDRIEFVRALAGRLGLHEIPGRPCVWVWSDPELAEWLRLHIYTQPCFRSPFKKVPELIQNVDAQQLDVFLKFFGDQSTDHAGRTAFFSSSRRLIDDLQVLHLKLGKRASVLERAPRSARMSDGRVIRAEDCAVAYDLNVWQTDKLSIDRNKNLYTEDYVGAIYCATVPNSTLITRRNDRVLISGNSCTGFGTVGGFDQYQRANGVDKPILASPNFLYKLARLQEYAGEDPTTIPPLDDTGAEPDLLYRAMSNVGYVSWPADPYPVDPAVLYNDAAMAKIVNAPIAPTLMEQAYDLHGMRWHTIPVGPGAFGMVASALQHRLAVCFGMFVDSAYMDSTGQVISAIDVFDPAGGGHWQATVAAQNGVLKVRSSWGAASGKSGFYYLAQAVVEDPLVVSEILVLDFAAPVPS